MHISQNNLSILDFILKSNRKDYVIMRCHLLLKCKSSTHVNVKVYGITWSGTNTSILVLHSRSSLINLYGKCGDLDGVARIMSFVRDVDEFSLLALTFGYPNVGKRRDTKRILYRPGTARNLADQTHFVCRSETTRNLAYRTVKKRSRIGPDPSWPALPNDVGNKQSHQSMIKIPSHMAKTLLPREETYRPQPRLKMNSLEPQITSYCR
ncbi:hypothetical protein VNO80_02954 [Phaseolus coccineus]|uniref:Uncharacterized protein n=1 Tax=Phaseolus coccineus TaxID=3886 RepID=A0AAN9NXT2_PHACN